MGRPDIPPTTSASQLVTYAMCPRLYWFRYCTDEEPAFRSANLVLGSAVHGAIGWWYEEQLARRTPTMEGAERTFRADLCAELSVGRVRWKGDDPPGIAFEAEGIRLVRTYLADHGSLPVVDVEQAFEVPFVDPETGEVLGRPLKGYFDLVGEDRVYELKTAAKAWSEFDLVRHLQIGAYCYVSAASFNGEATVECHVIVKSKREPRVDRHVVERGPEEQRWWVRAAAEIERAIEARIFPPTPSSFLCRDCEYERACAKLGIERDVKRARLLPLVEAARHGQALVDGGGT